MDPGATGRGAVVVVVVAVVVVVVVVGGRGGGGRGRGRGFRRRGDYFNQTGEPIDYKNAQLLRRFIGDSGRMEARRKTGITAKNQRKLAIAIKRARFLGLLPYLVRRRLRG